jgi:hypothetical protein
MHKKEQPMIDMVHNKIDNLNIGHKDSTDKDIHNKTSFNKFLEHFSEVFLLEMVIEIMDFNSK